jgi:hypothetical protein
MMRLLALWHRIDPRRYAVRTPECYGCIRFKKVALKDRSPTFRRLNGWVAPVFNWLRNSLLKEEEIRQSRVFARDAFTAKE